MSGHVKGSIIMLISVMIPIAILSLGGLYLIRSSSHLAARLFPSEDEGKGLSASEWQTVASR